MKQGFSYILVVLLLLCGCVGEQEDASQAQASQEDQISDARGNGTMCEIHNLPLQEDVVEIRYGLYRFSEAYYQAERELFPHANSAYYAGCIIRPPSKARVMFCPECRKAEQAWQAEDAKDS